MEIYPKLKDDLLNFINIKPENGLIFIKSLIPMMFVNFSPIGEYPDDVDDSFLKRIEYYVPRERLLNISYQLYPEYKEKRTRKLPSRTRHGKGQENYNKLFTIC